MIPDESTKTKRAGNSFELPARDWCHFSLVSRREGKILFLSLDNDLGFDHDQDGFLITNHAAVGERPIHDGHLAEQGHTLFAFSLTAGALTTQKQSSTIRNRDNSLEILQRNGRKHQVTHTTGAFTNG